MNITSMINFVSRRHLFGLSLILLGIRGLLYFGAIAPEALSTWLPFTLAANLFVDAKLKYQIVTFVLALVILTIVSALFPYNARRFYKTGNLESQGLPVWSRHVGDPILASNMTRRGDYASFMVAALENDALIHEAPAIVGCRTPSALAHATVS